MVLTKMSNSLEAIIECADRSSRIIIETLTKGSNKDGIGAEWRNKIASYHLIKGLCHLGLHLRDVLTFNKDRKENHLHKAISRLAMAADIEDR